MIRNLVSAGLVAWAALAASAPPTSPLAGVVREPDHTLRSIYGFSSNLINGPLLPLRDVLAACFSGDAGIVLTAGSLKLISVDGTVLGSYATNELHPVLGIAGEQSAAAWLPAEEKLVQWTASGFVAYPLSAAQLPGPVVALQPDTPGIVDIWVAAQPGAIQHFRVALDSGRVSPLDTVAGIAGSIAVSGSNFLFADSDGLQIRSSASRTRTLPLPFSDLAFETASNHWIHISSASSRRQWMLHMDGPEVSLSELPAAPVTAKEAQ